MNLPPNALCSKAPDFNGVENVWNKVKTDLKELGKREGWPKNREEIIERLGDGTLDLGISGLDLLKESSKIVVNWITSELFSLLNKNDLELSNSPVSPKNLGQLVKLISTNEISCKIAKDVLEEMFSSKKSAREIVDDKGLKQGLF